MEDYPYTVGEDQALLWEKITQLDLEIEEDLYEQYDQQLENNEIIEELQPNRSPKPKAATVVKVVKEEKEVQKEQKEQKEQRVEKKKQVPTPPSDEEILDQLWNMNRREDLKRSFLKECGIRRKLGAWNIPIGKYHLKRSSLFSYTYQLLKAPEKQSR